MTEGEIAALAKGFAPVLKLYVARELQPLRDRLAEIETERQPQQRDAFAAELLRRASR